MKHRIHATLLPSVLAILMAGLPWCVGNVALAANHSEAARQSLSLSSEDARVLHVLNRLTYGPCPGDLEQVRRMGVERFIQSQLHPETIPENPALLSQLAQLDTLQMPPMRLFLQYGPINLGNGQKPTEEQKKERRKEAQGVLEQAAQARLLRALESNRQLQEVMTEFWFNHFNIYSRKGLDTIWLGNYEETAIRPYALGKFRDLLEATSHHPAMQFYLDNWQNSSPTSGEANGQTLNKKAKFTGLNENYARELMELHTLGVAGGYTQQDVIALARILTGWGFPRGQLRQAQLGNQRNMRQNFQQILDGNGFYFDARRHDYSTKQFLGHTIRGTGEDEGEQALDILARHPSTAKFISYQLAQYFVSDNPSPQLVQTLASRFTQTDGDIRAVLDTLFHSQEFWEATNVHSKFKTPYRYLVSAVRASGEVADNIRPLVGTLTQMGMPLYGCETPNGYKYTQDAWLNPDAMVRRLSFATALANGYFPIKPGQSKGQQGEVLEALPLAQTIGNDFSKTTLNALNTSPTQLQSALILGSPEFMKY